MADTIPARFIAQAKSRPNAPAYHEKVGGQWVTSTWSDYVDAVQRAAGALIDLGLEPGQSVAILGFNRPEWTIMDIACMAAGGVPAGIYTTCSPEQVRYIVDHSEAPFILVEDKDQLAKVLEVRDQLPKLQRVVLMRGVEIDEDDLVMKWESFLARGEGKQAQVQERVDNLDLEDIGTYIYTSGTTGPPKAVMLTHRNLAWTAAQAQVVVETKAEDCGLSYLPLSHIAEQTFSIHVPATCGNHIYFAESIDKLPDNLKEVQPTVFFAVPRVWEKFHAKVSAKLAGATGGKLKLVTWARGVASRKNALENAGKRPGLGLRIQYRLANRLLFRKLKPLLGLGRVHMAVSGAAPISQEILEFFSSLDIVIREVYGQSEDCGPTSFNLPGRTQFGTVGPAFPGVEVKIADDGEILIKGPNVFRGYYKDEEATNDALQDGWLHSGDLGKFDAEGFLHITGRKKEIIITAGGKNIAPKNLEADLKNLTLVNEAVIIGDRRKFLSALVTLDPEALEAFAADKGLKGDMATLVDDPVVVAEIQAGVDEMNTHHARVEHVRKFKILPRNFTIDDGELTPTLKVKRRIVYDNWADTIEAIYADPAPQQQSA